MVLSEELREKLKRAFRPHAPIEDPEAFQGREKERGKIADAINSEGLHIVVYGEPGAGKTSLANVSTSGGQRIRIFCEKAASVTSLFRDIVLEYQRQFRPAALVFDSRTNTFTKDGQIYDAEKLSGNTLRMLLPPNETLAIVLDEMDRVSDAAVPAAIAELCKNLSTYQPKIKLVIVGVADTAEDLLRGHLSNIRNLLQVPLDRMTKTELAEIIRRGEKVLDIQFDKAIEGKILEICDYLPYYLHLLAKGAAQAALERGSHVVELQDFEQGLVAAAEDTDHVLRTAYETAILSPKDSEIYRQVIWAFASLDSHVAKVSTIAEATNKLAQSEGGKAVSVQAIGAAVTKLTTPEKKKVLRLKSASFYAFSNPLMRGFVRLVKARDASQEN